MAGLDKVVKLLAFVAVANAIVLLFASMVASFIRLIVSIIQMIFQTAGIISYGIAVILTMIVLILFLFLLWKKRKVLAGKIKSSLRNIKRRTASAFGGNFKENIKDGAKRANKRIDPKTLRKLSYAAHFAGMKKPSGVLSAAATLKEEFDKGLDNKDKEKLEKIKNSDLKDKFFVDDKDKIRDSNGNTLDELLKDAKNSDERIALRDKFKDAKKHKDELFQIDKDGNVIDPFTGKPMTMDSPIFQSFSDQEKLDFLSNKPHLTDDERKLRDELNDKFDKIDNINIVNDYMNSFQKANYNNDAEMMDKLLRDTTGLKALMNQVDTDAYKRILEGAYTNEDLDNWKGFNVNGTKHIIVPEYTEENGERKLSGLNEYEVQGTHLGGKKLKAVSNSEYFAKAAAERSNLVEHTAESQAGLPEGSAAPYEYVNRHSDNPILRSANILNESTRGTTYPDDVENVEDMDKATRDRMHNHADHNINPNTSDYNPDVNDFNESTNDQFYGSAQPKNVDVTYKTDDNGNYDSDDIVRMVTQDHFVTENNEEGEHIVRTAAPAQQAMQFIADKYNADNPGASPEVKDINVATVMDEEMMDAFRTFRGNLNDNYNSFTGDMQKSRVNADINSSQDQIVDKMTRKIADNLQIKLDENSKDIKAASEEQQRSIEDIKQFAENFTQQIIRGTNEQIINEREEARKEAAKQNQGEESISE